MNPTFRLVAFGVSAGICGLIAYLAMTHQIGGIADFFSDKKAVEVVKEEKKPPPPPPPPPPKAPPPPPPPLTQIKPPPLNVPAPEEPPPLPREEKAPPAKEPPAIVQEPPRTVVSQGDFISQPRGQDFVDLFPERALERGRSGVTEIACTVLADGSVRCIVTREDPANWGFGDAALKAARRFKVRPTSVDGRPTDGFTFTRTFRWNAPKQ